MIINNCSEYKTLNGSGPRYLKDILKFYHQARTLRSSRDHLRLEEPIFNMKTYGQRAFSVVAPPDYGTSSPLKFALVLMLIFLNLSWKRFFLKRCMTFSFVIFVFVFVFDFVFLIFLFFCFLFLFFSFLFKMCTVVFYVSLWLMIFLCPFLHCKALRTAMYKRYINSIIIILLLLLILWW